MKDLQYLEDVRRGQEEDRISALSVIERGAARNIENERRRERDRTFAVLLANSSRQYQQQHSAAITPPKQQTQPSTSTATDLEQSGSRLSRKKRLFKWLTWPK